MLSTVQYPIFEKSISRARKHKKSPPFRKPRKEQWLSGVEAICVRVQNQRPRDWRLHSIDKLPRRGYNESHTLAARRVLYPRLTSDPANWFHLSTVKDSAASEGSSVTPQRNKFSRDSCPWLYPHDSSSIRRRCYVARGILIAIGFRLLIWPFPCSIVFTLRSPILVVEKTATGGATNLCRSIFRIEAFHDSNYYCYCCH